MMPLTVDPDGRSLRQGETFLPLIIDTAWSSFADPTIEEWRSYLELRRRQGFTAVLVSVQPVLHDRDERPEAREPFLLDERGHHRFDQLDAEFFALAREYTRIAHEDHGLRLMITVLWNNYLPGTWGAEATPHAVMPAEARRDYVHTVARTFGDLQPIFVVGGDDSYRVPEANAAYLEAVDILRAEAPGALLTTHSAPRAEVPDELLDALDFHLHQSGHNVENQELTWRQPAEYLARRPRKPLIASEPPYEQHGKVNGFGRWSREEVRTASWTSVLAGAAAGIGYGAHGVWMWHTPGGDFQARGPSLEPFTWPEALSFPGALDISLMARLFRDHRLDRLDPAQQLLVDDRDGTIRCGASADRALVVLYLPYALELRLRLDDSDLGSATVTAWDLGTRTPVFPTVALEGDATVIRQGGAGDQLILIERGLGA